MKKRILILVLSTVIFSLIVISSLFIVISNYQQINNTRENLMVNNKILNRAIEDKTLEEKVDLFRELYTRADFRVTLISDSGEVIYDSLLDNNKMNNHLTREEIQLALENGEGSSIRYSSTLNENMLYFATKTKEGDLLRTSIALDNVDILNGNYIKYYIIVLAVVIAITVMLSVKLSQIIMEPINELEFVTSRITKGDFNRRVNAFYADEVGDLARTFNNMADKLQDTIEEVTVKQNRLEAILKSMDSGVIAIDRNSKIIMMNPYAKKIFDIHKDIIGENLMDHIRDFEFEAVFNDTSEGYKELKIYWPEEKDLRIKTADIINHRELIGTVAVVQDVTDIKRLENMRSEFVANVSHELKTPLTSIKGFAETLKYVDDEETKERFLGIINDEAERLTRLIEDILVLSNIEQNRENVIENIDVDETLKDIYYLIKNTADKKSIELIFDLHSNINLNGNRDKFKQMMINVIDNGIKYSEEGGCVRVISKVVENNCIITIKDNGVGIDKEHIPRLFERFYRVDKARSRAKGGTGLGLAIVKHIIKSFNGSINVNSELGNGTEFIITLPLRDI